MIPLRESRRLKRWAFKAGLALTIVTLFGLAWPQIVAVVTAAENLTWLDQFRDRHDVILRDTEQFREVSTRDRIDLRNKLNEVAARQLQMQGQIEEMSNMVSTLVTLQYREMGIRPPKRERPAPSP